jgi:hypothetical protein
MKFLRRIVLIVIAASLAALTTLPALARVVVVNPAAVEHAIGIQEIHTPDLMAMEGVVGTGVGIEGDGAPVIKVFTESRPVVGVPRFLDGVPVVIQVVGKVYALHHQPGHSGGPGGGENAPAGCTTTERCERPVPIGVSTGHPDITAGTIGARVTDGPNVYALSNNHVYANENNANIGDEVIQPGTYDGGALSNDPIDSDAIGTLSKYMKIVFSTSANNVIDAAIAESSDAELGKATPSDGYGMPRSVTVEPSINMRVKKYGRTTEQTKGRISAINATINVGYDSGVARFVNQIIIEPGDFSAGGDSGSLIVVDGKGPSKNDDRKPVGLLFAGSFFITVANPIDDVLSAFGVTIDGEE